MFQLGDIDAIAMWTWRNIIGLTGSLAAIAVALFLLNWAALGHAFAQLSAATLFAAAIFSTLSTACAATRWAALMAWPDKRSSVLAFLQALIANVFNAFTPGAIGADVYRVVIAGGHPEAKPRAAGLVVAERLFGVGCLSSAFLIAYVVANQRGDVTAIFTTAAAVIVIALVTPVLLIAASRRSYELRAKSRWINWSLLALRAVANLPTGRIISALVLSAGATATWLACIAIVSDRTGVSLPLDKLVMITVATEFARLLPISIQGIGVREATFASFAAEAGGSAAPAFAACAIAYALHFALIALFAFAARWAVHWAVSAHKVGQETT